MGVSTKCVVPVDLPPELEAISLGALFLIVSYLALPTFIELNLSHPFRTSYTSVKPRKRRVVPMLHRCLCNLKPTSTGKDQ